MYKTPLTPYLLAEQFLLPPAMIRLAIESGLEAPGGELTGIAFCKWFSTNYNLFKERAGLLMLELPADTMTAEGRECLRLSNVLRTLTDYFASRTSSLEYKEE